MRTLSQEEGMSGVLELGFDIEREGREVSLSESLIIIKGPMHCLRRLVCNPGRNPVVRARSRSPNISTTQGRGKRCQIND